ncbi:MAG: toprim domain-containing protein [Selenomonadaceae bacterium]|nr:toprim domain-containing protein [Selenomonadaceae bacterium]
MILAEIQNVAAEHLHNLFPLDKHGKGIVCPICGNGSGKKGDGVTFVKNTHILKCFHCGFSGDVIKLVAENSHCSYIEAAKMLAEKFGIAHHNDSFHLPTEKFQVRQKNISAEKSIEKTDFTEFFSNAEKNLSLTDYHTRRGFSLATCRHFHFGFIISWQHPKVPNAPKTSRLIVPTGKFSYLARDTRRNIPEHQRKYSKQKVGYVQLFNLDALNCDFPFVTEGELDAVSFYEIGFNAVALGSVSNINKFIQHLKTLTKKPKCIIVALDNDDAGKEGNKKLKFELENIGVHVLIADDIYGKYKDANDALIFDRESFVKNVKSVKENAMDNISIQEKMSNEIISLGISPVTISSSDSDKKIQIETAISSTATVKADIPAVTNPKLNEAKKKLANISVFNIKNVFAEEILQAAAYCSVYSPADLIDFLERCKANKIGITSLKDYIDDYSKPIKRNRKREEKELAKQLAIQNAKKHREELQKKIFANRDRLVELSSQPQTFERDEKITELIKDSLERDRFGKVLSSSVNNFELALNFDPLVKECIGYDAFSHKLMPRRQLAWTNKLVNQNAWANYDDASLQNHLNRTYGLSNERIYNNVLLEYAHQHSFHPVRDYFKNLPEWDCQSRASKFFIEALDIEDTTYAREISRSWLLAAVARIFNPGCKWDYTLVIKGEQGVGKSTVFSKLAGKWFNDSIDNINGKDALEGLLGSWIVEIGEMQATKKADNEAIKAFLSRQTDKFRVPYGRRTEEFSRQCVFAATTNNEEFLKDRTGGRRFFILISQADQKTFQERMAKFDQNYIDQLWAEILFYYKAFFKDSFDSSLLLPSPEVLQIAKDIQANYTEGSSLEGLIDNYLHTKIPKSEIWDKKTLSQRREFIHAQTPADNASDTELVERNIVSAVEIAYELLNIDNPNKERGTLKEITEILSRKDGWKRTSWKRLSGGYGQQRIAFERIPVSAHSI